MMLGFIYPAAIAVAPGFSPWYGLFYMLMFVAVLGMAYWTTRWVSKSYGRTFGTQIRVVDRLPIGTDKNFLMVRIGQIHYFLYQDRNGVHLLDKLKDYIPEYPEQDMPVQSFGSIIEKIMKRKQG